jgi:thiaminase
VFVERWTTPAFRSYVEDLQAAVDRQLTAASPEQAREATDAFLWVTRYERGFWEMALRG